MSISTALPNFQLRQAEISDCPLILAFIRELAEYERLSDEVVASVATLEQTLFGDPAFARVIIAEFEDAAVGYALYFTNFSTFTGRPGIYLEDLYVQPAFRGRGYGKCLLAYLAKIAVDQNYTRVEWSVLDWNEPSIQFYRAIGAKPLDEWTVQRLDGDALGAFAEEFK